MNNTINQTDLTDTYRTFHSTTPKYTFFSSANRTTSRIDHMVGHRTSLSKFKNTESYQIFSKHNDMKLEINNRKIHKYLIHGFLKKNTLLNNQGIKEEMKRYKSILRQMKMETQHTKTYKMQQKQF